jgi:outer membrane lipoprotein SlyB
MPCGREKVNWIGKLAAIGQVAAVPNVRNFYGSVVPGNAADDAYFHATKGDRFEPEKSYFSVRIVEMRLAEAGRYFTEFVPMCSCFVRFTYGRAERTVPFVLNSETVSKGLGTNVPRNSVSKVTFSNIYILRNVPVKADNAVMYAALCRFKDAGFARGLLNLLSDAAAVVGGPVIGAAVKTGVDLTNRLGALLGADDVDTRFGILTGNALNTSGYRVCAGTPSSTLSVGELAMHEGHLIRREPGQPDASMDDIDYLVIGLEYRATLMDENFGQISILPFHARWEEVRTKLLRNDKGGAGDALRELLVEVAASPDVTEAGRLALITSYQGEFEKWMAIGSSKPRLMSFSPKKTGPISPKVSALADALRAGTLDSDRESGVMR